jgi:hypothetical protein
MTKPNYQSIKKENLTSKPITEFIFQDEVKNQKEIEKAKQILFSFPISFLKKLLEREGINVTNNFPTIWYENKTIDLIWNFTFFEVKEFAKFW